MFISEASECLNVKKFELKEEIFESSKVNYAVFTRIIDMCKGFKVISEKFVFYIPIDLYLKEMSGIVEFIVVYSVILWIKFDLNWIIEEMLWIN